MPASHTSYADEPNEYELRPLHKATTGPKDALDSAADVHDRSNASDRRKSSLSDDSSVRSFELYTPDEEKVVRNKLDCHVVLFMSILYLLSFLDRSNIGNAKIAGLSQDLRLTDAQFEWLLTGFYITYILFEWMIMLYHVLPPHAYIAACVFTWGLIASLQAITTNFLGMLILRVLLGVSEAAFSPGVPFYLSFFYRREELAFRAGIQVSAAPLAASFAGSLAWLITRLGQEGPLAPWRLLFLVEGFPTVVVAAIAWHIVPDNAETAWFLTPRERQIAKTRLLSQDSTSSRATGKYSSPRGKRIDWKDIYETLRDPKCYLTALMFLNCNIAFSSMPVFLPTVINEMGYSSIHSQALSAPPYLVAFGVVLGSARLSDKLSARSTFVCFHALLAFVGYAGIAIGGARNWSNLARYIWVYPACCGFFSAITIIITWTMNNQESNARKGMGMTILNVIGQCGPLIGTRLYPDEDKPYYVTGMTVCAAAMLIVFALSVILRIILIRENRRRRHDDAAIDRRDVVAADEAEPLASERPALSTPRAKPFISML